MLLAVDTADKSNWLLFDLIVCQWCSQIMAHGYACLVFACCQYADVDGYMTRQLLVRTPMLAAGSASRTMYAVMHRVQ